MYKNVINTMKQQGIELTVGLKDEEINEIEQIYEIIFPEELKQFYKEILPISNGFYNWRDKSAKNVDNVKKAMQIPLHEILECSSEIDWNKAWGEEPIDSIEREIVIKNMVLKEPKLIPLYSHRYMASVKCEKPPIFSIYGTDVIYFAKNIMDYFLIEFKLKEYKAFMNNEVSYIPFWSDLL